MATKRKKARKSKAGKHMMPGGYMMSNSSMKSMMGKSKRKRK